MSVLGGIRYYTREELCNTPSRKDGVTAEKEQEFRRQYVKVITEAGIRLRIPQWAIYVSTLMCHHYFAVRSFRKSERFLIASACLFLGAKIQESPRHLTQVATTCMQLIAQRRQQKPDLSQQPWEDKAQVETFKEQILVAERAVLYALGFTLDWSHPYRCLLAYKRYYVHMPYSQDLIHTAWMFLNDSTKTDVALRYPPEKLASAMLFTAATIMGIELPDVNGQSFYETYKLTFQELLDMFESVVGRYTVIATKEAVRTGRVLESPDSEVTHVAMADAAAPNRTPPDGTPSWPGQPDPSTTGLHHDGSAAGHGKGALLVRSAVPGRGVQVLYQAGHPPAAMIGVKPEPGGGDGGGAAGRKRPAEEQLAGADAQRIKVEGVKGEGKAQAELQGTALLAQ